MKPARIYLAGPMTGYPEWNFPAFMAAAASLRAAGHDVVNPAEINGVEAVAAGKTWADCMRSDIRELMTCEGVAVLPGWQVSRGASLEVHIAEALGMSVRPFEAWLAAGAFAEVAA